MAEDAELADDSSSNGVSMRGNLERSCLRDRLSDVIALLKNSVLHSRRLSYFHHLR